MNSSSRNSRRHEVLPPFCATIGALVAAAVVCAVCTQVRAADPLPPQTYDSQLPDPRIDVRYDGVLAESYGYHRQSAASQSIMPAHGAYRYGFPVETYRWGWFGAERYYPYVVWHRGYNRDCVRWGYRRGY